jgi:hypothetical protein
MLIGPRSHYVSLNEAVTLTAFGEARTPEQEITLRRMDQHKVRDLVIRCQDEAKEKPAFFGFRGPLPYLPLAALKDRLNELRHQWPPSANDLHRLVERVELKWRRYDEEYAVALDQIFDSLRQHKSQLVGRTGVHRAAPVRVIKPIYFFGAVTIGHDMSSVGPPVAIQELPRPGAILHTRPGLIPIYYGVRISTKTPSVSLSLRARITRPEVRAKHEKAG